MATASKDLMDAITQKFGSRPAPLQIPDEFAPRASSYIWGTRTDSSKSTAWDNNVGAFTASYNAGLAAERADLMSKYKTDPKFADWTEAEITRYADNTIGKSGNDKLAADYWETQNHAWAQADKESRADRQQMLDKIASFETGLTDEVNAALQREKAYWDARGDNAVKEYISNQAAQGKVANSWILKSLRERSTAEGANALALRQTELNSQKNTQKGVVLNLLNSVLGNTNNNMTDPATALKILTALGQGSSTVAAVKA